MKSAIIALIMVGFLFFGCTMPKLKPEFTQSFNLTNMSEFNENFTFTKGEPIAEGNKTYARPYCIQTDTDITMINTSKCKLYNPEALGGEDYNNCHLCVALNTQNISICEELADNLSRYACEDMYKLETNSS